MLIWKVKLEVELWWEKRNQKNNGHLRSETGNVIAMREKKDQNNDALLRSETIDWRRKIKIIMIDWKVKLEVWLPWKKKNQNDDDELRN
jgi:hypothetical protein